MKKLLGRLLGKGVSAVRPTCTAILAAAGSSQRMGGENKLLLPLDGMPVLAHTLRAVDAAQSVDESVIAAREGDGSSRTQRSEDPGSSAERSA